MMKHQVIGRTDRLASPGTLWQATAPAGPQLGALAGTIDTDVLVVGGGIAGMTTALQLSEAGVATVLLEAGQPGAGSTGWSGGVVAPDYIRHTPDTIGAVVGRQAGERLTKMIGGSGKRTFDLIAKHGIDCDAHSDGFYTPAHTEALAANQRGFASQWQSRGFDVTFVEAEPARQAFGADRYCGALRFGDGGGLNPLAFVRGLADATLRHGGQVFAETPVENLVRIGDRWHARTPAGLVTARRLVLAANGGNAALHPAMRQTALPLHIVQFATAPLSAAERARVLPGGGSFTDKVPYLFSARFDGPGHLVSAFSMSLMVRGDKAFNREARRRLTQHFAGLSDPQIDFLWQGVAWVNPSLLPEIYDVGDDALVIQADNGRGISTNTVIGIEVAKRLVTNNPYALSIQTKKPTPIRLYGLAAHMPKLLMSLAYLSN